ncbi:MAG: reverse transcriptase domain-containing protein [Burkholderiales bacterium]
MPAIAPRRALRSERSSTTAASARTTGGTSAGASANPARSAPTSSSRSCGAKSGACWRAPRSCARRSTVAFRRRAPSTPPPAAARRSTATSPAPAPRSDDSSRPTRNSSSRSMSCAPGCPRCASAKPHSAPSSTRSTPSCTTPRPTSSSRTTSSSSSPASPTGSTSSASKSNSESCGSSSARCSSAATTTPSPSDTPSPPRTEAPTEVTHCVGAAISPLLANMFMHYAFDAWMARELRLMVFESYCDDVIVHDGSEQQARDLRDAIASRLADCGLELNEHKTRIVYCKDDDRRAARTSTRRSTSWATRSARGCRRAGSGSTS